MLLDQLHGFERLQSLARVSVGGPAEVGGVDTVALAATVDLGDRTNASRGSVVQVAQDRGAPDVEPVWVVGRQLLELGGLDDVHGVGHLKLAGSAGE